MTVTQATTEHLTYANHAEGDGRWADAAHAYQEALDSMPHPTSGQVKLERDEIEAKMRNAIMRSQQAGPS